MFSRCTGGLAVTASSLRLAVAAGTAPPRAEDALSWVERRLVEAEQAQADLLVLPQQMFGACAEGEALLGWFNGRGRLSADTEFDGNAMLLSLANQLQDRLTKQGIEIAHLKMTLQPTEGPDLGSVSLTRNEESPQATHRLSDTLAEGDLMVNLRAEADPEQLKALVLEVLNTLPQTFELRHVAAFRPGRPTPTHRLTVAGN